MSAWTRLWGGTARRWRFEEAQPEGATHFPRVKLRASEVRPARLLFINQYYWPDHASTAQHLTDLAESLAEQGHECHVLCGSGGYKSGETPRPHEEIRNGVHIHRVHATSLGRRSTLRRMTDYLSFYAAAILKALSLPRFDVVSTLTTPPIIGLIGTILRWIHGSKHVYWSMDLHPDASLALGRMSRRNPVVRGLAWLSDAVYRHADRVVVLGDYMADRIVAKGVPRGRLRGIPVWSRRDEVYPVDRDEHSLRADLGLEGKFVAMYSGNLGLAHSFDEFLEAARRLRDREDIVFLFVGDGPRMAEVRAAKESEGLDNIHLHDYFPREMLHASLSLADVHLISMREEMTGIVVPGKLYGVMASGRPAVFVGPAHCETADTIRNADCGVTIRLGDVDGLVASLEQLASEPETAEAMGERGREGFLAEHERDVCCRQWADLVAELNGTTVEVPARVHVPFPTPPADASPSTPLARSA